MTHHGLSNLHGMNAFCHVSHAGQQGNRFGRLFSLPPLYTDATKLKALGAKGGPMDGGTAPKRTSTIPVGEVFFGQFIDHDITLDVTSSFSSVANPGETPNARTPSLDLDNIYGLGPDIHPYFFHATGPFKGVKLLTGADAPGATPLQQADLARSAQGTAIIGDPRNDENRIISQLQLAIIRFHNKVADTHNNFVQAKQLVTWHYQWVVIHDFLVHMCGAAVVADILGNGRRFYCPNNQDAFIPVEFSVAAYRFGHSMIPQKIQVQKGKSALELFGTKLGGGFSPLSDLGAVVDWHELTTTSQNRAVQKAESLDGKLATTLLALPFIPATEVQSLATRNLLRGQTFLLPSGENVARAMGRSEAEISVVSHAAKASGVELSSGTPLWFYVLLEAEHIGRESSAGGFEKGEGLGPVGARIVAETLIGLIELDPRSYLGSNRNWTPADGVGVSTLGELLTF